MQWVPADRSPVLFTDYHEVQADAPIRSVSASPFARMNSTALSSRP